MSDPRRYMPYPELVEGPTAEVPYRVLDSRAEAGLPSPGVADLEHRRLYVPLAEDGRPIARHELAHVRWSPRKLPRVRYEPSVLHAVEDARVNLGLERAGIPVRLDAEQRAHVLHLAFQELKRRRLADFTLRWVASLGTDSEPDFERAMGVIGGSSAAFAAAVVARLRGRLETARGDAVVAPFRAASTAARELAKALHARGVLDPAFREISSPPSCCLLPHAGAVGTGAGPTAAGRGGPFEGQGSGAPGTLGVVEAPLPVAAPRLRRGLRRAGVPAPEGPQVGAFHRWAVDRAVFVRRVRRRGGSVLVDTSGSMGIAEDEIDRLLEASGGAALVAIYSGDGDRGELRIVARGGRRAAREHLTPYASGNVVDLPALEWLAGQPGPRIWVSDGRVTGVDDKPTAALRRACGRAQAAGGIRRVERSSEAARLLAGRGAPQR